MSPNNNILYLGLIPRLFHFRFLTESGRSFFPSILFARLVLLKTVRIPRNLFQITFCCQDFPRPISILSNYPLSKFDPFTEFSLFIFLIFVSAGLFELKNQASKSENVDELEGGKQTALLHSGTVHFHPFLIVHASLTVHIHPFSIIYAVLRAVKFLDRPLSIFDRPLYVILHHPLLRLWTVHFHLDPRIGKFWEFDLTMYYIEVLRFFELDLGYFQGPLSTQ